MKLLISETLSNCTDDMIFLEAYILIVLSKSSFSPLRM